MYGGNGTSSCEPENNIEIGKVLLHILLRKSFQQLNFDLSAGKAFFSTRLIQCEKNYLQLWQGLLDVLNSEVRVLRSRISRNQIINVFAKLSLLDVVLSSCLERTRHCV